MKEKLYTIPLNDAVDAADECPLCYAERKVSQDLMDFVLGHGASYMESDMREKTDLAGFCRRHFKEMFDYGNTLGEAWILSTHIRRLSGQLDAAVKMHPAGQGGKTLFGRRDKGTDPVVDWVREKESSCYLCKQLEETMDRYEATFFHLWKSQEFRDKIRSGKGFCLPHFGNLLERAAGTLSPKEYEEFYALMTELEKENLARIQEDVEWLIKKFDHTYASADWKNSRDAVQRSMQKLKGGYPSDEAYRMKK